MTPAILNKFCQYLRKCVGDLSETAGSKRAGHNSIKISLIGLVLFHLSTSQLEAAKPGRVPNSVNYGRAFEPITRPAFIPLPPGAIEPLGWLRDWCQTAGKGYTGHMDEVHPDFRKAWAADYRMNGDQLTYWYKGAWPYEGGGYWFDGLVRLGYALHDDSLIHQAKSRLGVITDRMNEKSVLFMWWLDRNNQDDIQAAAKAAGGEAQEWPVWANGLLGRALTAYYAASGDKKALQALELAYSGNPTLIGKGFALTNLWPAFETYTWTGNTAIKEALTAFFEKNKIGAPNRNIRLYESWYNRLPDETIPWYLQPDHGVHFNESVVPWVLGYLWTGHQEYLNTAYKWYDIIERGDQGMQPYDVPVSDENCGPTGSFRGTESCNVAAFMASQLTLLRVGGNGRMADRVERAFFNAAPAVVSRDFTTHVYDQSPNRINAGLPGGEPFSYKKAHDPLCCTANLNRILPYYVGNMWMATYDNGLAALHYGPCKVSALAGGRVPVVLTCKTDYPFNEFIDIAVSPARKAVFPLSVRVPGWCTAPELSVNGASCKIVPDANGFVRLNRLWKPGDRIRLHFPMTARVKVGHDNDAMDTPYATVSYGPLLFALGIPDTNDANTPDTTAKWNYALDVTDGKAETDITVEHHPMPAHWDWPIASPLKLCVEARSFDWAPVVRESLPAAGNSEVEASAFKISKVTTLLPAKPVANGAAPMKITLVPYGCTKFRISMFPVTDGTYKVYNTK